METCQYVGCCARFGRRYIEIFVPCHFQGGNISLKTLIYSSDSDVDGLF